MNSWKPGEPPSCSGPLMTGPSGCPDLPVMRPGYRTKTENDVIIVFVNSRGQSVSENYFKIQN